MDDEVRPVFVEATSQIVEKLLQIVIVDIDSRQLIGVQIRFVAVKRDVVRPAERHVGV